MPEATRTTSRAPRPAPHWAVLVFYWGATRLMALVVHVFGRFDVRGLEHLPAQGGVLVVANHLHSADPPLLGATLRRRRLRFMAKIELFEKGLRSLPVKLFDAFPVRRFEADLAALRTAQKLIEAGEAVCILPEGHRNRNGVALQQPFPGAALVALRTRAPIVPVAITGTERIRGLSVLLQRPRITVTVGEPFHLARRGKLDRVAVESGTAEIMRHIATLLPPAYRGDWAPVAGGTSVDTIEESPARG